MGEAWEQCYHEFSVAIECGHITCGHDVSQWFIWEGEGARTPPLIESHPLLIKSHPPMEIASLQCIGTIASKLKILYSIQIP